jgi:hypothetical protein
MTHDIEIGQTQAPSPERRRRVRDATMFERQLVEWRLKAAREDRPPIDRAVGLRRERRETIGAVIFSIGWGAWWVVLARGEPVGAAIIGVVAATFMVSYFGRKFVVLTRRIKRGDGPSGLPPREAPMTDELPATASARRLEHWTWRALPGLALGVWVSPRRQHELFCDLGYVEDYRPPLLNHPRLRRAWLVLGIALWVAWAWLTLILYPFVLGLLAIVHASDRLRAWPWLRPW